MRCFLKINKSKSKTIKVRYNYSFTKNKRLKYEKVDKMVFELTRQFVSAKHGILTPAENDEIAKIDWDNLKNQREKVLVKHLIDKVIYKNDELKLEINRESILNLQKYQASSASNNNETFNHQLYISLNQQTINIITDAKTKKIPTKVNKTLLKALVTGYGYKKMIEEQNYTINTIAHQR